MASPPSKTRPNFKVVILGDAAVGKTSLIQRYIDGTFKDADNATIGASFFLKQWGPHNVAFWDTAGEERYSGLSSFYCRGASAAIMAYDICSSESFESLWARFLPLLETANPNCLKVIVGTKRDLVTPSTRQVLTEEGHKLAKELNETYTTLPPDTVPFFETSSRTGENVTDVYELLLNTCLPLTASQKHQNQTRGDTIHLDEETPSNSKKCSC